MPDDLAGKRIALLFTHGVEQVELATPRDSLTDAGADVVLLAPSADPVQAVNGDINPADTFKPDETVADADPDSFDALVLPGGTADPDRRRRGRAGVHHRHRGGRQARRRDLPRPVDARGDRAGQGQDPRELPEHPHRRGERRRQAVDQESFTCYEEGSTLVTSRKPDDLDAFTAAAIEAFAAS